jgi:hypothetical protein
MSSNKKWLSWMSCVCLLTLLGIVQADPLADWETAITAGNPLHWYKFNETTGKDCLDAGSAKLNGTYDGPTPGQQGFFGSTTAATFTRTGGTNTATFTGAANLAGQWTVEYIVMSTKAAAANDSMALHDSDTTSVRLAGWTSVGEVGFTLYGVADYQFAPSTGYTLQNLVAPQNEWIHLTFRRDGSGTQVFVNGEMMGTSSNSVDLPRLRIGGRGAGPADWLQGVLDEAVVYNRALSNQDILAHAKIVGIAATKARNPNPADGALAVAMPLVQWKAGLGALLHNVYLGTSPDLTEANLVASRQPFTMVYYAQGLKPGTTYYWRVDEIDVAGVVQTGNVWSFIAQDLKAYRPSPADGATDAAPAPVLTWLPGQTAVKHHLYFGNSSDAVTQGAAATDKGELTDPTFTPGALESLTTYYWRVDELVAGGTVRTGLVWRFTTCLPVDDFEGYTDDLAAKTTIFDTWIDGFADGFKSSGSTVGNDQAPFAERTVVHSGKQSMPMQYDNTKTPFFSEAVQTFSPLQDWTVNGVTDLTLYFRGVAANGAGSLYVAVEDNTGKVAVATNPNAAAVTLTTWTEWKTPLSSLTGVNLAKVKKMYIGVGDRKTPVAGGAGRIYVDDIQVTRP